MDSLESYVDTKTKLRKMAWLMHTALSKNHPIDNTPDV